MSLCVVRVRLDSAPRVLFRKRIHRVAHGLRTVLADVDRLARRLPQRLVRFGLELDGFLIVLKRTWRIQRRVVTITHGDVIGGRLRGGERWKRGDRERGDDERAARRHEGQEHGQVSGMQVSGPSANGAGVERAGRAISARLAPAGHPMGTPQAGQCSRFG